MDENTGGKRLVPSSEGGKGKKIAPVVGGVVAAVLVAGYVALCVVASGDRLLPHSYAMGVDVSGMTAAQAEEVVAEQLSTLVKGRTIRLSEPTSGASVSVKTDDMVAGGAVLQTADQSFLTRGAAYLGRLFSGGVDVTGEVTLTQEGEIRLEDALTQLSKDAGVDETATTYQLTDTAVVFTKGKTGIRVDTEAARADFRSALLDQEAGEVTVSLITSAPEDLDMELVRTKLYTAVADAYYDKESGEIVPSVVGMDLDTDLAETTLKNAAEGQTCQVALTLTQPDLDTATLTELLFRDVLGEASTKFTGTSDRKKNIALACSFLNDEVIMPGEEFSYNKTCSPYTQENGYGKAGAYVNGKTVDTTAGGICQASSTLYWATLKANLTTVERYAHRYEPTYVTGGLDATVYGDYGEADSLDFRFINSTDYPIKIEAYIDKNNNVRIILHGTDTTGIHGEPYSTNRTVTQYAKTLYEANADIPQGTTKADPERTAYNAVTIETYQKLVDANGNTVSTTYLYKSSYKARNAVIFYNAADAQELGIDPATGIRTEPAETVTPQETDTATPAASESPSGEETVAPPESLPSQPAAQETESAAQSSAQPAGEESQPPAAEETQTGETGEQSAEG